MGVWIVSLTLTLLPEPLRGRDVVAGEITLNAAGVTAVAGPRFDIVRNNGLNKTDISGTLTTDTVLTKAGGPHRVPSDLIVPVGITLTIEPGTTVHFETGTQLIVYGRLLCEGTAADNIRLTCNPATSSDWEGIVFDGTHEDNRMTYTAMDYADGGSEAILVRDSQLLIDHMTWTDTDQTVLELDNSNLIVRNSVLPSVDNDETVHGYDLPADGYLIFEGNTFGTTTGYSDVIDFTRCKRPNAILQILNNVFLGGSDDGLDLDGTDAHIEGNIFMNFMQDVPRASSSNAIATGKDGSNVADVTIVRNVFINNEHDILLKEGSRATIQNNTFYGAQIASINFDERNRDVTPGHSAFIEGCIFYGMTALFQNQFSLPGEPDPVITINQSLVPGSFHSLGFGNIDADPLFADPGSDDFRLLDGSPAIGTGPNGLDMGALVPAGASISGEPPRFTTLHTATLTVAGPGITHYRYSLDGGPYGPETPTGILIRLAGLPDGDHIVHVIGKNSAAVWQQESAATVSKLWTITAYTLTVAATHGSVLTTPALPVYAHGTTVTLTAVPDEGYHFVQWQGDATGTANPFLLTMDGDKAVTATFVINTYTITATAGAGGRVAPSGPVRVQYGANQEFDIVPDIDYHVADVLVDGGSVGPRTRYEFISVAADHSIHALFETDAVIACTPSSFTVTSTVGQSATSRTLQVWNSGIGTLAYLVDTTPSFLACHPTTGSSTGEPTTHVISIHPTGLGAGDYPGSLTITADRAGNSPFHVPVLLRVLPATPVSLETRADPAEGGTVLPAGRTQHEAGTAVTLVAQPACGWTFDHWSGDLKGSQNPTEAVMNTTKTVTAHFTQIPGPNLTGDLTDLSPRHVVWGTSVSLHGHIRNQGSQATTESFWIEFWAVDPATQWRGYFCDSIGLAGGLESGQSLDLSSLPPVKCYNNIPFGTYRIEMKIDATNGVPESCERDNQAVWYSALILPDRPNLEIRGFDFSPQDVKPGGGDPIAFSGTLVNTGSQPTTGGFWVEFRVWPDLRFQRTGPYLCDSYGVSQPLAPGESMDLGSLPPRLAYDLPRGVYYVGVILDPLNSVSEQREDDNVLWQARKPIYIGPRPTRVEAWMRYR